MEYFNIKNFLLEKECAEILDYSIKNLNLNKAKIGGNIYNGGIRKSLVSFTNYNEKFPYLEKKLIKEIENKFIIKGHTINFENSFFQFTKYETDGHFSWHRDSEESGPYTDRYCSIVIQLNENYEGGYLELDSENENDIIRIPKETGNLSVFLSQMMHRVTNVDSGVRYTIVNWFKLKKIENFTKTLL